MEKKATKGEMTLRIRAAYKMIMKGVPYNEIIDKLMEDYDIKDSMARNYVTEAYKKIEQTVEREYGAIVLEQLAMAREVYRLALENKEYNNAIKAQEVLNKLLGLYTVKTDITSKGNAITGIKIEIIDNATGTKGQ